MRPLTPEHRDQRDPYTRWLTDGQDQQLRRDLAQLPDLVALVATHPQPAGASAPAPTDDGSDGTEIRPERTGTGSALARRDTSDRASAAE